MGLSGFPWAGAVFFAGEACARRGGSGRAFGAGGSLVKRVLGTGVDTSFCHLLWLEHVLDDKKRVDICRAFVVSNHSGMPM